MCKMICRGKRKDNGEWVEGYYCRFGWCGQEKDYIIPSYASACTPIEVISDTVCRYTELEDKNGKKIFEGDILIAVIKICDNKSHAIGQVVFENGTFKILVTQSKNSVSYKQYENEKMKAFAIENNFINRGYSLEIIGNIYDTPELMK